MPKRPAAAAAAAAAPKAKALPVRQRLRWKQTAEDYLDRPSAVPADADEPGPEGDIRRPAAKASAAAREGHTRKCRGRGAGQSCRFGSNGEGGPAEGHNSGQCSLCSLAGLRKAMETAKGRAIIVRLLKKWCTAAPDIFRQAFAASAIVDLPPDEQDRLRKDATVGATQDLLAKRQSIAAGPTAEEMRAYEEKVQQDRALVQKKFFPARQRTVRHAAFQWTNPMAEEQRAKIADIAPNDAGLPAASTSPEAKNLETWCKKNSWQICGQCFSVETVRLKEPAAQGKKTGSTTACKNCAKPEERRIWIPKPEEVPEPLRGLSRQQIEALRPLDVDCGPEWKADFGYYFHSSMIRFSWAEEDVEEKVKALQPQSSRKQAKKAGNLDAATLKKKHVAWSHVVAVIDRPSNFSWRATTATTRIGCKGTAPSGRSSRRPMRSAGSDRCSSWRKAASRRPSGRISTGTTSSVKQSPVSPTSEESNVAKPWNATMPPCQKRRPHGRVPNATSSPKSGAPLQTTRGSMSCCTSSTICLSGRTLAVRRVPFTDNRCGKS